MTSNDGDAWAAFPHDQARSRAYRWVHPTSHVSDCYRAKTDLVDTATLINIFAHPLPSGMREIRFSKSDCSALQGIKVLSTHQTQSYFRQSWRRCERVILLPCILRS